MTSSRARQFRCRTVVLCLLLGLPATFMVVAAGTYLWGA